MLPYCPAFHAAAGQPHREAFDVMVAAGIALIALDHWRAAELAAPNDQRVIQHAVMLEVGDEGIRAAIGVIGTLQDVALEVAVVVPAAVIKMNEAHAALGEPPREQAIRRERAVARLRPVQLEHVLLVRPTYP